MWIQAEPSSGEPWRMKSSGRHATAGKTVSWRAIANLRIRDGKIEEEWVNRDELGMPIAMTVLRQEVS